MLGFLFLVWGRHSAARGLLGLGACRWITAIRHSYAKLASASYSPRASVHGAQGLPSVTSLGASVQRPLQGSGSAETVAQRMSLRPFSIIRSGRLCRDSGFGREEEVTGYNRGCTGMRGAGRAYAPRCGGTLTSANAPGRRT